MSGGAKTVQKQEGSTSQTLQLPPWLTEAGQRTFGEAEAAAKANPIRAYDGQITAGRAGNQAAASDQAAKSLSLGQPELADARAFAARAGGGQPMTMQGGQFDAAQAAKYRSPYVAEVQSRTLDEMGRRNKMEMAGLGDAAQASKAYGGGRHAVLEAETRKGQSGEMYDYLARSNEAAYGDAAQKFEADRQARLAAETQTGNWAQQDRSRDLGVGSLMGQLGQTATGINSENIANLIRTGTIDQATEQDRLGAAYNEFLRMQDAPMERYRDLMAMLAGAPRNVTTTGQSTGTTTSKQDAGILNTLLGLGQVGAGIFSDRRLKRDVRLLGRLANGLGVYAWRYLWGAPGVGVMADEVERIAPHALGPRAFGFQTVDYSKLGRLV
jgi:hypothetical protein